MVIYAAIPFVAVRNFFRGSRTAFMHQGVMAAYFPLVLSSTIGFGLSWVKSGGMENDPSVFVLIALLLLPRHLSKAAGEAESRTLASSRPLLAREG